MEGRNGNPDWYQAKYTIYTGKQYTIDVLDKIGFRYCVHKQMRLTAAQTLWRFLETIKRQRQETLQLAMQLQLSRSIPGTRSLKEAKLLTLSRSDVVHPPAISSISLSYYYQFNKGGPTPDTHIRRGGDIPMTRDWLTWVGALHMFEDGAYAVPRTRNNLPFLFLPVISREAVGEQEVFSITTDGASMLANGITTGGNPIPPAPLQLVIIDQ
jgi:hypothetical protein